MVEHHQRELQQSVRTRIAPSPTGEDIHIGNVYTALINYAFAKKHQGTFIVRIEDTDRLRYVEGSEQRILKSLTSFGILFDEGPEKGGPFAPYRQSERLPVYKQYAQQLIKKERAYYCFCSKERLDTMRKQQVANKQIPKYDKYCLHNAKNAEERIEKGDQYVIRLNVPVDKKIVFTDVIRGEITFDSSQLDDQVLLKSDGYPTYHLGVVVDDYLMKISHVIRAEEWISSTPKHILLYEAFGWELPVFAHLPILRNADRSKLSKRKNPVWASWYLQEGFLPEAILNFLALLGWSHPEGKEVFSLDKFIPLFDLKDIKPVGPIFDIEKLKWINGEYIRMLSDESLKKRLLQFDPNLEKILKDNEFDTYIVLAKMRMKTLKDFRELITVPTDIQFTAEEKVVAKKLIDVLSKETSWTEEVLLVRLKSLKETDNLSMKTIYYLIIGKKQGLPLIDTMLLRTKEGILSDLAKRIQ